MQRVWKKKRRDKDADGSRGQEYRMVLASKQESIKMLLRTATQGLKIKQGHDAW